MRHGKNLVIEAEPGAGKTTRVPPALLDAVAGQILVLEPRRLPARMAARRVAGEMDEPVGQTVGYRVRFEQAGGPRTRLWYLTEGVLHRQFLADPCLRAVSVVILDEFHERHIETDLALALLRRLQQTTRPDLRILVMSATLESQPLTSYLGCEAIKAPGRSFEVSISYAGHSGASLEQQVADAASKVMAPGTDGHILAFLPGAAEIRRALTACSGLSRTAGLAVLPLHGDLSPEEQDRAVSPSSSRKLILSTNVAESSVTIEGVATVIDSGLARIASDSPASGLPTLELRRISKASATQRAGRAGRTRPGQAIRLYSPEDFARRPGYDIPEIRRRDLSQVLLQLRAMQIDDLPWLEPPPEEALATASALLERLGANEHASALARLPVHPRLARLLLEATQRHVAQEGCRVAAHLSSGERSSHVDLLQAAHADNSWRARQIEHQLRRLMGQTTQDTGSDTDLRIAILTAYPDRVSRRRSGRDVQLASGQAAVLGADWGSDLLVAADIEDRRNGSPPLIRVASEVTGEWLLDLYPDRIREHNEIRWNRSAERVEAVSALLYDQVVIEESRNAVPDPSDAAELLCQKAIEAGLQRWCEIEELHAFLARVRFASEHSAIEPLSEQDVYGALGQLCKGLRSFRELESATCQGGLLETLRQRLGPKHLQLLNELAPERIALRSRQVRVAYAEGKPPAIASRLQDFFGMKSTPRIAGGRVPLVVELLAPNQRPVQTTTDLAGFWERLYPTIRKELSRRYPKHSWPEKPE